MALGAIIDQLFGVIDPMNSRVGDPRRNSRRLIPGVEITTDGCRSLGNQVRAGRSMAAAKDMQMAFSVSPNDWALVVIAATATKCDDVGERSSPRIIGNGHRPRFGLGQSLF